MFPAFQFQFVHHKFSLWSTDETTGELISLVSRLFLNFTVLALIYRNSLTSIKVSLFKGKMWDDLIFERCGRLWPGIFYRLTISASQISLKRRLKAVIIWVKWKCTLRNSMTRNYNINIQPLFFLTLIFKIGEILETNGSKLKVDFLILIER